MKNLITFFTIVAIFTNISCKKTIEPEYITSQVLKNETSSNIIFKHFSNGKFVYQKTIKPLSQIDTLFSTDGPIEFVPIDPNFNIDSSLIIFNNKTVLGYSIKRLNQCSTEKNIFCVQYWEKVVITGKKNSYSYTVTDSDLKKSKNL